MSGKIIVYKSITDDNESYWPEWFPLKTLQSWYNDIGPVAFASQYQSSPIDLSGNFLKADWLHYYNFKTALPNFFDKIIIYVDPAVSQSLEADFFALAVGGRVNNVIYLLHLLRTKIPIGGQLEILKGINDVFKPHEIYIEASGQQEYLIQYVKENSLLNVIKPDNQWLRASKDTKFSTCAAYLNSSKALIPGILDEFGNYEPIEAFKVFKDEWISYPTAQHDDTLDAVSGVINFLVSGVSASSVEEPSETQDLLEFINKITAQNQSLTNEEKIALENYYNGQGENIRRYRLYSGINEVSSMSYR